MLLDLKLPKVDGLQVLREIKARPETQAIPVIALTSSKEERDLVEGYRLGVNSYIQKPVDFEKFRETIRAIRVYWATVNQAPPQKAFAPASRPASFIRHTGLDYEGLTFTAVPAAARECPFCISPPQP